ncbi:uncharacterized protein CIMG_02289 [Coccidioides immitis RS]|uniref:Uncharacterized protein n=1 Tax=Coccidioides immitis (strain RS) TaxID=246410 RepID=J3KL18_COCIM|nr:uncharacterized protein CIMG_02289 [Coccidioides immitis RS]EAS36935.3 hypothetical protein CIMG_02289 [Coccidioides immitis RS]
MAFQIESNGPGERRHAAIEMRSGAAPDPAADARRLLLLANGQLATQLLVAFAAVSLQGLALKLTNFPSPTTSQALTAWSFLGLTGLAENQGRNRSTFDNNGKLRGELEETPCQR